MSDKSNSFDRYDPCLDTLKDVINSSDEPEKITFVSSMIEVLKRAGHSQQSTVYFLGKLFGIRKHLAYKIVIFSEPWKEVRAQNIELNHLFFDTLEGFAKSGMSMDEYLAKLEAEENKNKLE